MSSNARTSDKFTSFGLKVQEQIKALNKRPYGKIGFPTKDFGKPHKGGDKKPLTVGEVAVVNEFGTIHIPQRSFIRSSFDKNVKRYKVLQKKMLQAVFLGEKTVDQALKLMCLEIVKDQKNMVQAGGFPFIPNAPSTIAAKTRAGKKGDKPLINTGQMKNTITYIVIHDGGHRESD